MVIYLQMGKTSKAKSNQMNLRLPLPRIYYYHNKRLQVKESKYIILWTHTPIPNWTCFVVTFSHFQCTTLSTWLTNRCTDPRTWLHHQLETWSPTWERYQLQSSSVHHTMKITKLLGHKTLRCINTTTSSSEIWTRANSVSGHNLHEQNFALHSCNCATFDDP